VDTGAAVKSPVKPEEPLNPHHALEQQVLHAPLALSHSLSTYILSSDGQRLV
jgi:hypothetical protein